MEGGKERDRGRKRKRGGKGKRESMEGRRGGET